MTNQYAMDSCLRDSCDRLKLIARQSKVSINQPFTFWTFTALEVEMGLPGVSLGSTRLNFSNPSKNGVMGGASIFVNGQVSMWIINYQSKNGPCTSITLLFCGVVVIRLPHDPEVPSLNPGKNNTSDFSNWDPLSLPSCDWYMVYLVLWRNESGDRAAGLIYTSHLSSQRSRVQFPVFPKNLGLYGYLFLPAWLSNLTVRSAECMCIVKTYIRVTWVAVSVHSEAWNEWSLECTSLILVGL